MNTKLQVQEVQITQNVQFNASLFTRFIEYTDVKETTLKGYAVCLRAFARWLQRNNIIRPTREDIKAYKEELERSDFTAGTKQQYLRAVKHFFKWTSSESLYPNIADNIKGAKVKHDNTKKDALKESDIINICNSIDRNTTTGKRDYAMILLSVTGGLRIIELHRANIEDIKTIAGEKVLFIQGKGRDEKDEYIKLVPEVQEALEAYLNTRPGAKKKEALFVSTSNNSKGQRITEPSISRLIKNIFRAAGYDSDRITAHSLRHTAVTMLLKSGSSIQQAQHFARHADPATTGIYAHNIEREKDHSEQAIFNYIFKKDDESKLQEAQELLEELDQDELNKALQYLRSIRKEMIA
jgi:integrase/recombinase XerD